MFHLAFIDDKSTEKSSFALHGNGSAPDDPTKISKCSGSPRLPLVITYTYIWLLGVITLEHVILKQLPVGLMVLCDGMVHFLKIEKIVNKSTKTILWL